MRRLLTLLTLTLILLLGACGPLPADIVVQPQSQPTALAGEPSPLAAPPTLAPDTATPVPTVAAAATTLPTPTASATATAVPPSPTPDALTFAVIGDYGSALPGTQDVAALVRGWDPDLVLTVGDNNYPSGAAETIEANVTQHYGTFIESGRFFPALGNHDYYSDDWAQPYFDYFELPGNERYYDFVAGDVHFFAVNSDWHEPDGIRANSTQAAWLEEQLAASTAVWQVVYLHVPPYVSLQDKEVPVLRWPFAAWGADLVLSGHAHVYERLWAEGIPYVVNGLGGHSIYEFDETPRPESQVRFNEDFGALLIEASAARLEGQFVTRSGAVVDTFALTRP